MGDCLNDVETLARRWNVSTRWVYERLKSRELRGAKVGARWVVPEAEAERFIRDRVERGAVRATR